MTIDAIFSVLDEVIKRYASLKDDFLMWQEASGARAVYITKTFDNLVATTDTPRRPRRKFIGRVVGFLARFRYSIFNLSFFSIANAALGTRDQQPSVIAPVLACAAGLSVALSTLWRDISVLSRRRNAPPRITELVDSMAAIAISYAMLYTSIPQLLSRPVTGFEALYFSVITMSTTGYGDIVPRSWPSQLLVITQVVVGMAYTVALFGMVLSRLSAREQAKQAGG
jgi:hypothetical protein